MPKDTLIENYRDKYFDTKIQPLIAKVVGDDGWEVFKPTYDSLKSRLVVEVDSIKGIRESLSLDMVSISNGYRDWP